MTLTFASPTPNAIAIHLLDEAAVSDWLQDQPERVQTWAKANGFDGALGKALVIPSASGDVEQALLGYGSSTSRERGRFHLAAGLAKLPKSTYRMATWPEDADHENELLGALLSRYRFDRYKTQKAPGPQLVAPDGVDAGKIEAIAAGEELVRTLINTPAEDMGPVALEAAARDLAKTFAADVNVITGENLVKENFPLIHTVGRAAAQPPRLIDMRWGTSGPSVTLVGKGVCFDTGGLNLKPGASMGLMKKDMGGAANVLGLARMLMATKASIRLRVLIPAVENAVSGSAFRPGDIFTSRKGLTVEINNTDAEGRLVLADALAVADEETPDVIVSMATLTGAARVAVGPDLAPFYTDDDTFAASLSHAAAEAADPVWRMPFHTPYESMIEPGIADLDNAPKGGFAGSITAALFLRRFVTETPRYVHFDVFGWQPNDAPARPKGGAAQGIRALHAILPQL